MAAYQAIDGTSVLGNRWLLTEVLRGEWGFEGFVVTDWDNVGRTCEGNSTSAATWRRQRASPSSPATT